MSQAELFDNRPKVRKKKLNLLPENPDKEARGRFPSWLHRPLPKGSNLWTTGHSVKGKKLHTVCEEAKCPNLMECWSKKTATFLIMGKECTRSCGFCDIDFAKNPEPLEADEPKRIAESVGELGLKHVVITMVARDDISDGGASHLAQVMRAVRSQNREATIEVLTSDFEGNESALDTVLNEQPEIFNHNIETVRKKSSSVRHKATYDRTLKVLRYAKEKRPEIYIKSGLMVGLGENPSQVKQTIRDLKEAGCDIITIGQYLQASRHKLRVQEFVTPEQFEDYASFGRSIGVANMYSGPFVRSSYNAKAVLDNAKKTI
jgi:lipoyl synthase